MDLDETFTEALDGCSLEPNLTILSQTKPNHNKPNQYQTFSEKAKTNWILMKLSRKLQMDVVSNQI